jgi:hypothetical protein
MERDILVAEDRTERMGTAGVIIRKKQVAQQPRGMLWKTQQLRGTITFGRILRKLFVDIKKALYVDTLRQDDHTIFLNIGGKRDKELERKVRRDLTNIHDNNIEQITQMEFSRKILGMNANIYRPMNKQ